MSAKVLDDLISQAVNNTTASEHVTPSEGQRSVSPSEEDMLRQIAEAEERFNHEGKLRGSALAFGLPVLIALTITLTLLDYNYHFASNLGYWDLLKGHRVLSPLFYLAVSLTVLAPIYYFHFRKRHIMAEEAFVSAQQALIASRLTTVEGRENYYRRELIRLSSKAAHVFYGDGERFALASKWAEGAGKILDGVENDKSVKVGSLSVVQSCLNSLNELVAREEREQAEEVLWQKCAIAVMFLFVALLIAAAIPTYNNPGLLVKKVFGVPLSVMLWGAAGSLAAILYRFYTEQGQIRFSAEFRWLIARPIIGIIMGAVVYLALVSGLVLISNGADSGAGPGAGAGEGIARLEALWIVSFLAGFSDKFYLGVIDLLVARTVRTQEIDSNTVITEKERIPDPKPTDTPGAATPAPPNSSGGQNGAAAVPQTPAPKTA
jgi:hypothetical protein